MRTDEEVYKILMAEKKKRRDIIISVLSFFLVICVIAAITLTVLYFKNADDYEVEEVKISTDGGEIKNSNILTTNSSTNGDVIVNNNTPVIVGIAVAIFFVLVGFLWLLYYVKSTK